MSTKRCPIPGCQNTFPDHLLMCRDHWAKVPAKLKSKTYYRFQDWRNTARNRSSAELKRVTLALYRDAVGAAILAVQEARHQEAGQ